MAPTVTERFRNKIRKDPGGCWVWTGALTLGYGRFELDGRLRLAHRVAYEFAIGPIPDGLQLDHLCRNRACVRPDHLEPVSARVNTLRSDGPAALNSRKTHCPQGHEYTSENIRASKCGRRRCLICHRERERERRESLRMAG